MKHTLIFPLFLLPTLLSAQTLEPQEDAKGKWGYVDAQGREVVKYQYDFAAPFADGKALVVKDDKKGFLAADGAMAVKPEYTELLSEGNGLYRAARGGSWKDGLLSGAKWGVIDTDGREVVRVEYDEIGPFVHGMAYVLKGGKYGFLDTKYHMVVEPKYTFVGTFNAQGLAWATLGGDLDKRNPDFVRHGKWGVIDRQGREVVPVRYTSLGSYVMVAAKPDANAYKVEMGVKRLAAECGVHHVQWAKEVVRKRFAMLPHVEAFAMSEQQGLRLQGVADTTGAVLVPAGEYVKVALPQEGVAVVVPATGGLGYYSLKDRRLANTEKYTSAFSFKDGMAVAIDTQNRWHFIGPDLRAGAEGYEWISPRVGGVVLVKQGGLMQVLDADTHRVIAGGQKYIFPPVAGYMCYQAPDGKFGYLRAGTGEVAQEAQWVDARSFRHGVAEVQGDKGFGLLGDKLQTLVTPQWKNSLWVSTDNPRYYWAATADSIAPWRCIDTTTDAEAFAGHYDKVANFEQYRWGWAALVNQGGKWGVIDTQGRVVVPIVFDQQTTAGQGLDYLAARHLAAWRPVDSRRFILYATDLRNQQTLDGTIDAVLWDY